MIPIVDERIERYLGELNRSRDPILLEMEARAEKERFPIIGPQVGRLCLQLALAVGARDVFEMGSGFGYSTWFFARAVGAEGRVVHTDGSAARSDEARGYLGRAGLDRQVRFEVGDALEILKDYPGPFDVIFIDVDKEGYPEALELARSRVRPGGLILTDNVLWSGRPLAPVAEQDESTRGVSRYNEVAFSSDDLLTTIVPIRDGLAVSLKLDGGKRR
jgi:predicted O-methyltransferase YrrM